VETTYAVLRMNEGGKTYFEDLAAQLNPIMYVPGIPLVEVAEPIQVSVLTLSSCDANYVSDWHPAPRRQFVFVLRGGLEVTSGNAETRRFEAGTFFLVEDTSGEGHQTRTIGADPCLWASVACADHE
jgi:hypothetical protein